MTLSTSTGSFPGTTAEEYAEWVRASLGELSLPAVPEMPGRGVIATMTGRAVAVVAGLVFDVQPAGWRLTTGAPGVDLRRARSLLAQDLDAVEELGQDFDGSVKTQLCGPWTLAATVERPRGDKLLADHGARRELAEALAEGVGSHVADVRRRVPRASHLVVQVDEPALAAVVGGRVPTASGHGRHRAVDLPEASRALETVLGAIEAAGAEPWVHSCAPGTPLGLLRGAGARGLVVDTGVLDADGLDVVGAALEEGDSVALGVLPSTDPEAAPTDAAVVAQVHLLLEMLGLSPEELGDRLLVSPGCGLAGASVGWARRALALCRAAAERV